MGKLLRAGFFRLKKETIFWVFVFLSIGIAGITLYRFYDNNLSSLDRLINEYIWYIGIFIAIFVSIFVGKEYSQGIIRNKIIVRSYKNFYLFI